MEEKKLFLLDAYALIYRAYYAMIRAPRVTSKGLNTSAVFGFCNTLDEILKKENPSHIAVCFDPKGGTFRHEVYPEYKAQREAQPEDITRSLPYIKEIIKAHNIPVIEIPGYEADDVIGTLSRMAEKEGFTTYMMTPDKDYGQLVTEKVFMYRPALKGSGFEVRGVKQVCDLYGISSPEQVIDMLALEGDASDNIPGCPGVGEKTAVKLINEWGSVENLLENVDKLKGAIQKKVSENIDKIKFSKYLVTIKTDVPVDVTVDSLARKEPDVNKLMEIYTELEFKSFIAKLGQAGVEQSVSQIPSQSQTKSQQPVMLSLFDVVEEDAPVVNVCENQAIEHNYREITSLQELDAIIDVALKKGLVGVSVYGYGSDSMTSKFAGLAVSVDAGTVIYVNTLNDILKYQQSIQRLFGDKLVTIVSHDVKHAYIVLKNAGIDFSAKYYDTSVAYYLLQPEMKNDLANVAYNILGCCTADYLAEARQYKKTELMSIDDATNKFCEAADVSLRLYSPLQEKLKSEGLSSLMADIELPFLKVLADMEIVGVRVDVSELAKMSSQLTERMREMEQEVYRLAGVEFNIASPMQVGDVLFGRLEIDKKAKRTKTGSYSTTEEILEKYRNQYPIVDYILKIRGLRKLLTTYINALPELINPVTGKIHTSYNQTVTATGRISSANPNLQNIPVRTDDGREIRRAFIADDGDLFYSADYSQIELRVIADLSGDKDMIEAFLSGADIHQATAAKIYGVSIDEVASEQRRKAKTANFGIIYGISAFGLSERLSIPRAEAKMLIDGYFQSYPQVKTYIDETIEKAKQTGYVTTIKGRKRMLPDINSNNAVVRGYAERNAVNAPIQGSAADIIKIAMVNIARRLDAENLKSRMIMQVHDELVFNVKPAELDKLKAIVEYEMENAYHGHVPLVVSSGIGHNWLEAH